MVGNRVLMGMATCHELSLSDDTQNGPSEDIAMFQLTGWVR